MLIGEVRIFFADGTAEDVEIFMGRDVAEPSFGWRDDMFWIRIYDPRGDLNKERPFHFNCYPPGQVVKVTDLRDPTYDSKVH